MRSRAKRAASSKTAASSAALAGPMPGVCCSAATPARGEVSERTALRGEQLPPQVDGVLTRDPRAQQQGEQLGVAERCAPVGQKFLPWLLVVTKVVDAPRPAVVGVDAISAPSFAVRLFPVVLTVGSMIIGSASAGRLRAGIRCRVLSHRRRRPYAAACRRVTDKARRTWQSGRDPFSPGR